MYLLPDGSPDRTKNKWGMGAYAFVGGRAVPISGLGQMSARALLPITVPTAASPVSTTTQVSDSGTPSYSIDQPWVDAIPNTWLIGGALLGLFFLFKKKGH